MYPYEKNALCFTSFDCFPRKGTLFLLSFYSDSDFKIVKKVYPYAENAIFLLVLTVFLVRVHFFYYFLLRFWFQNSKKSVPLTRKMHFFLLVLTVFLVRVHFFYYFEIRIWVKNSKKKCTLTRIMHFFLLVLTVFLVRVHFFYYFLLRFWFQNSKKNVPLRGKQSKLVKKSAFSS